MGSEDACLYVKTHRMEGALIVAVCDKECIGKVHEEGELCLDLKNHAEFYKGELCTKKQALEKLRNASSVNLVGEKAVLLGMGLGIVKKTIKIAGVPHAQAYLLPL